MNDENQTGVEGETLDPVAGDQTQTDESGQQREESGRSVPLDALQAERERRQLREEENRLLREQLEFLSQKAGKTQPDPEEEDEDPLKDEDEEAILTVKDYKRIEAKKRQREEKEKAVRRAKEQVQDFQKDYPDGKKVIDDYLPEMIKQNPRLAQILDRTPDVYEKLEMALNFAKANPKYHETTKKPAPNQEKVAEAKKMVANSNKPRSASSVAGAASTSSADYWANLSDKEFLEQAARRKQRRG